MVLLTLIAQLIKSCSHLENHLHDLSSYLLTISGHEAVSFICRLHVLHVPVQYSKVGLNVSGPLHVKILLRVESANCQPVPQSSVSVLLSVICPDTGVMLAMFPFVCSVAFGREHIATEKM